MRLSPKFVRFFFYGLVVAGGLFLCAVLSLRSVNVASDSIGMNPMWLGALCCVIPIVVAGIFLANESR